jgi:dihydrofolate reductase
LFAAAFVSLDGVMQAPGAPPEDPTGGFTQGGWTVNYWDEPMGEFMGGMFTDPFDLLLGRKTYEIFAAHWPYVPAEDPVGKVFNAVTKYVATTSTQPLSWNNSINLGADVVAEISRLKRTDGPMLLTQGSSVLLQTLLAHDLVDEFRLLTFPLVLGSGKRLFGNGAKPGALKLIETKVSSTGVLMSIYRPDGAIKIGTFELPNPSQAELARREKIKREG